MTEETDKAENLRNQELIKEGFDRLEEAQTYFQEVRNDTFGEAISYRVNALILSYETKSNA